VNSKSTFVPMRSASVNFSHGMVVNDTDLTAAMHYPVQVMQAVNRAVYGCGVVCGFLFSPDPDICGQKVRCDPSDDGQASGMAYRGHLVQVARGTAIDCNGLPIELCEPALVDVNPTNCGCSKQESWVYIAIRRTSASEAARGDCCDQSSNAICTRTRDHVELKGFAPDKLPEHICANLSDKRTTDGGGSDGGFTRPDSAANNAAADDSLKYDICECMLNCDPYDCCGKGWVLLGKVEGCASGVKVDNFPEKNADGKISNPQKPYAEKRFIKLIECVCRPIFDKKATAAQAVASATGAETSGNPSTPNVRERLQKAKVDISKE